MVLLILFLAGFAGCDQARDEPVGPTEVPTISPTYPYATNTAITLQPTYPPPAAGTKEAFATAVEETLKNALTAVALTPSGTPGSPTATRTPAPSPTIEMGFLGCGTAANSDEPQYFNCWHGMINGQLLRLAAGREGRGGDITQGLFAVLVYGADNDFHFVGTYRTPVNVGAMKIASVNGNLVTLIQDPDGQPNEITPAPDVTIVFDLGSQQWMSPSPGPSRSPSPIQSPLPSPSP
jgi:hypothetical protein